MKQRCIPRGLREKDTFWGLYSLDFVGLAFFCVIRFEIGVFYAGIWWTFGAGYSEFWDMKWYNLGLKNQRFKESKAGAFPVGRQGPGDALE